MSSKSLKYSALLAACLGVAALAGCGSSNKSGSTHLTTVGDTACVQCHSAVTDSITGESIIAQYQRSPHNVEAVGCEGCHGAGSLHNGVGPIQYPLVGATGAEVAARCVTCHTDSTAASWTGSKHDDMGTHLSAVCYRCHSHEGAVLSNVNGYTGDYAFLTNDANKPVLNVDSSTFTPQIKCATCHEHGGNLRAVSGWDPNGNLVTDQYDLCTSCHGLTTGGTANPATPPTTPVEHYHANSVIKLGRIITDTHFDDPATGTVANVGTTIEGYVVRAKGANACADCHSVHNAMVQPETGASIQQDWARSAHAGKLLKVKEDAANAISGTTTGDLEGTARTVANIDQVTAVGVSPASGTGPAWEHYNWDDNASRGSCQRCHTATGAANFMNNPSGYNAANNSFTHLQGWTSTNKTSPQNELLYCWGCHTNAGTGDLRKPGAITETYAAVNSTSTGTTGTTVTVSYPDVAGSNVCMTCHLGRQVGESIKAITDADGVLGFVNSHYLAAGGQLFGTTGYEYAGKSYDNPSYFAHDKIGSAAAPGTGSNGPCAGCHMTTPNSHSFTNVTKDNAGVITALTSTACVTCHNGTHGAALTAGSAAAATFLETEKEHYHAALAALDAALQAKGIYFAPSHPYFFTAPYVSGGTNTAFTNWAAPYTVAKWKDVMGAAFNYNLLEHDPGGYAHNRIYSKRLIFDAIDFIDNGVLDGVITVTGDAATYLDGSAATTGVQRP